MKITVKSYLKVKEGVALIAERLAGKSTPDIISNASIYTCAPICVVAYFYGELFGYTKEIISTIEDHSKMFGASLEGVSIEFTRESERAREGNRETNKEE